VTVGSRADFSWAASPEADRYRLQLAATPDFKAPLRDLSDLRTQAAQLDGLQPGVYHWRLASLRANGDQGPWGEARSFDVVPPPPAPLPPAPAPAPNCLRNASGACVRGGEATLNLVP
jgi:hypothetical protein